jgi:hypothetical protein
VIGAYHKCVAQRVARSTASLLVRLEQMAKMLRVKYDDVVKGTLARWIRLAFPRHPSCQSDRAEIVRSRMPITRMSPMKALP